MTNSLQLRTNEEPLNRTELLVNVYNTYYKPKRPGVGYKLRVAHPNGTEHKVAESGSAFFKWPSSNERKKVDISGVGFYGSVDVPKNRRSEVDVDVKLLPAAARQSAQPGDWLDEWIKKPRREFESGLQRDERPDVLDGLTGALKHAQAGLSFAKDLGAEVEPEKSGVLVKTIGNFNTVRNTVDKIIAGENVDLGGKAARTAVSVAVKGGAKRLSLTVAQKGTLVGTAMALYDIADGVRNGDGDAVASGMVNVGVTVLAGVYPPLATLYAGVNLVWTLGSFMKRALTATEYAKSGVVRTTKFDFLNKAQPWGYALDGSTQWRYAPNSGGRSQPRWKMVSSRFPSWTPGIANDHRLAVNGVKVRGRLVVVTSRGFFVPLPDDFGKTNNPKHEQPVETQFEYLYKRAQAL